MSLTSELFAPPEMSSYVNASRIKFDNCPQTFIACNAPKPNSFSQFWHMVIQEKVLVSLTLIIIILSKGFCDCDDNTTGRGSEDKGEPILARQHRGDKDGP